MKTPPKKQIQQALNHLESAKKSLELASQMAQQDQNWTEVAEINRYLQIISETIESDNNQCGLKQLLK